MGQQLNKRSRLTLLLSLGLIAYQIVRLVVFANVYGGLQEDSGWFSAISRSLAEQGTYTTMTSAFVDPTKSAGINIQGRFDVQDAEGRIWFFTDNSTGPGSIVPNALVLKLLGTNFWSLRVGTLIFLAVFLLLASYFLYQVGGPVPILLFHSFFIFYPHLLIPLGYEPYGEMAALVYILLAYLLLIKAMQAQSRRGLRFFLCGLLGGMALISKLVSLFSLMGLFALWGWHYAQSIYRRHRAAPVDQIQSDRPMLKHALVMGIGLILPLILWELVHLITLTAITDFETYQLHLAYRFGWVSNESTTTGASPFGSSFLEFVLAKLLIISQISHPNPIISLIVLLVLAGSGPWLAHHYRARMTARNIVLLVWFGWLIHTIWFVTLDLVAFVRHDWFALIFGIMLLSWLITETWRWVWTRPRWAWRRLAVTGALTVLLLASFASQRHAVGFFVPDGLVETWRLNYLSNDTLIGKYEQLMPWYMVPRDQQDPVIEFLTALPSTSHIFFGANLQVTELPVIVGRVFYPIERRPFMPHSDQDVVVLGSRAFSPWRKPPELVEPIRQEIKRRCPQVLLENDYYIICSVPPL